MIFIICFLIFIILTLIVSFIYFMITLNPNSDALIGRRLNDNSNDKISDAMKYFKLIDY